MTDISLKQGASLQLAIQFANDDGSAMDITGLTLLAQVRTIYGALVDVLTMTPTGSKGQVSVLQATDLWPTGRLACDIKVTASGATLKSDTLYILVSDPVTT